MTQQAAEYFARNYGDYRARKMHGQWVVWCDASDHVVDFDACTIERVETAIAQDEAS